LKGAELAVFCKPCDLQTAFDNGPVIRSAEASALPPEKGKKDGTKRPAGARAGRGK